MVFQLPSAVDAEVIASIVYSIICLLSSFLLVWLLWIHNDRASYIACIAYTTLLITATSVWQQFYDYTWWRDILTEQFYYARENADSAEVQYMRGAQGIKLVLTYIRLFGFTIASSFVFFFALSLAASVYGWFAATPRTMRTISIIGRILPVVLTTLSIGLLLTPPAQKSFLVYMIIANAQYVLSLLGSAILLLMILFRYINSRRNLTSWKVIYGNHGPSLPSTNDGGSKTRSIWAGNSASSRARSRAYSGVGNSNKAYDSWLVIRLSIAFLVLCVFEYTSVVPRISARNHIIDLSGDLHPDLSVKRARTSIRGYAPGVSPSLAAFLVFGTTKTFQKKIYDTFVPKAAQRLLERLFQKKRDRKKRNPSIAVGAPAPEPPQPPAHRAHAYDDVSLDIVSPQSPPSANFSRKLPPQRSPTAPAYPPSYHHTKSLSEAPLLPVQTPAPAGNPPRRGSNAYPPSYHSRSASGPQSYRPRTFSRSEAPLLPAHAPAPEERRLSPDITLPPTRRISPLIIPNLHSKFSTLGKRDP